MTSDLIYGVLTVAILVALLVGKRRHQRLLRDFSAAERGRLAQARQRMLRFPPRWAAVVCGAVAGPTLGAQQWTAGGIALVLGVVFLGFTEQNRREVLRELGFIVQGWGPPRPFSEAARPGRSGNAA